MTDNVACSKIRYVPQGRVAERLAQNHAQQHELTPINDASPIAPGRILFIHKPGHKAAGIVTTIVNMPQGLSLEGVHHHHGHAGQGGDDDEQRGQRGGHPGDRPQQVAGDLRQRQAVLPHRGQQHHEIMYAAGQAGPDHDPGEAGKIAPLRRQHRPDQRPRSGDGGEVDAEQHQPPGGLVVDVVAQAVRGRDAVVQHRHLGRQEGPVKTIGHQEGRQRGDHQPE